MKCFVRRLMKLFSQNRLHLNVSYKLFRNDLYPNSLKMLKPAREKYFWYILVLTVFASNLKNSLYLLSATRTGRAKSPTSWSQQRVLGWDFQGCWYAWALVVQRGTAHFSSNKILTNWLHRWYFKLDLLT